MIGRTAVERPLANRARKALAELNRAERRIAQAEEQAAAARDELGLMHRAMCERFGREIPTDALVLDLLEQIDVEPGDRWVWRGQRNNKSIGVVREGRRELSVVRFLAIAFGVIEESDFGLLYPINGDADDVNPWHRQLRRSKAPIGNPDRFGFTLTENGS